MKRGFLKGRNRFIIGQKKHGGQIKDCPAEGDICKKGHAGLLFLSLPYNFKKNNAGGH